MPDEELYDLDADPHEINNLAKAPERQETLKRLRAALERWIEDCNDQGRQFEPPDVVARQGATK
jgi:N-sulfoglucosamine sulfohydrolase